MIKIAFVLVIICFIRVQYADEQHINSMFAKYEIYGTGQPIPEAEAALQAYCEAKGFYADAKQNFWKDKYNALKFAANLKHKVRDHFMWSTGSEHNDRFRVFCGAPIAKRISVAKNINKRIKEAIKFRMETIGFLVKAAQPDSKITLSNVLCILRTYITLTVHLFEDRDGAREVAETYLSPWALDIEKAENVTKVRGDTSCILRDSYMDLAGNSSLTLAMIKAFDKLM